MKLCPSCGSTQVDVDWRCRACGAVPPRVKGFIALSPDVAHLSIGFRPEYFERLAQVEEGNFWFVARNQLIVWATRRFFSSARKFCEIGCGTGYVLSGIDADFPELKLSATDIYAEGLTFAAARVPHASFLQMDARVMPFESEFDLVGAFDVIEHIEQDETVLTRVHRALVKDGGLLLTVPQHPWMWSQQDEHACHVRRYTSRDLREKLERAGFHIELMTSFVSVLLPLMYATRRRARVPEEEYDLTAEMRLHPFINDAMRAVMGVERGLIKAGLKFPLGGSLLVVARKSSEHSYS